MVTKTQLSLGCISGHLGCDISGDVINEAEITWYLQCDTRIEMYLHIKCNKTDYRFLLQKKVMPAKTTMSKMDPLVGH